LDQTLASGYLLSPGADGFLRKKYERQIGALLNGDKKKTDSRKLRFVFCSRPGVFKIEEVTMAEILRELRRQDQNRT
jgi:hypothetical protein